MSLLAVKKLASESAAAIATYSSAKWAYPTLIRQRTDLSPISIGPIIPTTGRPFEGSSAKSGTYPHVIAWSETIDWVFLSDNATASATRVIILMTFNKDSGQWAFVGVITLTLPIVSAHTIRGLRVTYDKYTDGLVTVGASVVTGATTAWSTSRLCHGSRIGFGATLATAITTWYEIYSIASDTGMLLTTIGPTITAGTSYVIEDLRVHVAVTNVTVTYGGLYIAKGLRIENFTGTATGTTIAAANTIDNLRAVYWLAYTANQVSGSYCGICATAKTDWVTQEMYLPDLISAGNYKIYKHNTRKALTLTAGKDATTCLLSTGNNAFTGTGLQLNNGRIGTLSHGPCTTPALYMVSSSRVLCAPLTAITEGGTGAFAYTMTEVPPGTTATYAATAAMNAIEIDDSIDRLIILTSGATAFRSYVTKFNNVGDPMDHIFLVDDKLLDATTMNTGAYGHGSTQSVSQFGWSEGGMLYLVRTGTTNVNTIINFPIGADWAYAGTKNQRLIAPKMLTPNCDHYDRVYVARDRIYGSDTLGIVPDTFNLLYRTSGIDDNSGGWTAVPEGNDLTGIAGAAAIQFAFDFRTISPFCLPAKIYSIALTYEDLTTDSHWQLSVGLSDITTKKFAFRMATAYGGTVPRLKVSLYDAVAGGGPVVTDDSVTKAGTWEKSTNGGGAWGAYDSTDKANETTYIRFTPASLSDSINVTPVLSLYV